MFIWLVTPKWKKRVIKRELYTKDKQSFVHEVGFLSGIFKVYTEDAIYPNLLKGIDILHCEYETEIVEINDECWERLEYNCDEPTKCWVEDFLDDEPLKKINYYGWQLDKKEIIIKCDMNIERI
jgi:hypothetical protein